MNLSFTKLHIVNFLSFKEAELDFVRNGYTLVEGINENPDDLAESNGSGKSSLFEALMWCLTGDTIRGGKTVCNLFADNGCLVELEFCINSSNYKVVRTKEYKPQGSSLKFFIDGVDSSGKGIKETEKIISEYIPDLTTELLGSVVILGQGLPQRFSNNTPSGRKDVLEKLSKSDFMIEDLKKRISDRKTFLTNEIRDIEDSILATKTKIEALLDSVDENTEKLNSLKDESFYNNKIDELTKYVETKTSELTTVDNSIDDILYKASCLDKVISDNELNKLKEESDIKNRFEPMLSDWKLELNKLKLKYDSKVHEISSMKSIKDVCPTCGQKIPNVIKPDTTELEKELDILSDKINEVSTCINREKEEFSTKLQECSDYYKNQVSESRKESQQLKQNASELSSEKQTLKKIIDCTLNEIQSETVRRDSLVSVKNMLIESIDSARDDVERLSSKLLYYNNEKTNKNSHLEVVNKMNTSVTREFRGYLLTSVIEFINRKAKEYSLDVFETDKINFSLEGNNISIQYDGKDYSNLSGGERQKVDLIVQFSIRDMLCKYLNFSCNCLVVDELFDNLDSTGCERVLNLISTKLSDVENIYIITHRKELQIPFDNIVTIIKGADKISRIV